MKSYSNEDICFIRIFGTWAAVFLCVLFNIVVSILLVSVNKFLFYYEEFHYGALLTFVHYLTSSIFLGLASKLGIIVSKAIQAKDIIPLSISHVAFVTLNNISLQYNSMGFYQVMKAFTIPMVVFLQFWIYGKTTSFALKASLAMTCVGILLATMHDVQLNTIGITVAILGEIAKAISQVMTGQKHKELGVNSLQLLNSQASWSTFYMLFVTLIMDDLSFLNTPDDDFKMLDWDIFALILISSVLALCFNLSNFLLIDSVGPVTYNVIGHVKTILIVLVGYLYFDYTLVMGNVIGIVLTLVGLAWYGHLKLTTDNSSTPPQQLTSPSK